MPESDGRNEDAVETLRREMHELIAGVDGRIEGVHDHIRLVAEAAAGQSEAIIRRIDEMNAVNRAEHETFKKVLVNHESRISPLEQRAK
jgi:hypothetical protein